jgi:hypothetical protein
MVLETGMDKDSDMHMDRDTDMDKDTDLELMLFSRVSKQCNSPIKLYELHTYNIHTMKFQLLKTLNENFRKFIPPNGTALQTICQWN